MAILRQSQERGVGWRYIAPGEPTQNAFIRCPAAHARMRERGKLQRAA